MSGILRENSETPLVEASRLVRSLAEPLIPGDTIKSQILRASRKLSWMSFNRVKDIWYADPRMSVSATELDKLRGTQLRGVTAMEGANTHELQHITAELSRIATLLAENARASRERNRPMLDFPGLRPFARRNCAAKSYRPLDLRRN